MLNYEVTLDDSLAYNEWLINQHRKQHQAPPLVSGIFCLFLMALGILFLQEENSFYVICGTAFLMMGVWNLIHGPLGPLLFRLQRRQWKKMLEKHDSHHHYLGPRQVSIEADGLRMTGRFGERMLRWSAMSHVATPTLDVFYIANSDVILVPRRAFKSEMHREGFLEEIERRRIGETAPAAISSSTWWTQGDRTISESNATNTLRH